VPVKLSRLVVPVVALLLLAGCGTPAGTDGADGSDGGGGGDLWLIDDPDTGAVVATGEFMGVDLLGFSCDVSLAVSASGTQGVLPTAYAGATLGFTTVDYHEDGLISTAQGELVLPADVPPTIEISTTKGFWDIGDGGENSSWTPSVTLTLTEVPVPIDGCPAASVLGEDLIGVDSTAQEIIDAFTEVGLRDVSKECPDEWFTWAPPNMSCEEFAERAG